MSHLEAWLTIKDQNGKILEHKKANSFVRGFIDVLKCMMGSTTVTNGGKDTSGTLRNLAIYNYNLQVLAGVNIDTYGIMVGSGSNAVTVSDFQLQTKIAHGTGAGQLSYGAVTLTDPAQNGTTWYFEISRTFTNNTAGSITVNEVGIYGSCQDGSTLQRYCFDRTLSTFTLAATEAKTITYTIKVVI